MFYFKMRILNFYYCENSQILNIEFSIKEDGDKFYRVLELSFSEIEYYSPEIITKHDLDELEESFIKDVISQYLLEKELPEPFRL